VSRIIGESYGEERYNQVSQWLYNREAVIRWTTDYQDFFYQQIDNRLELPTVFRDFSDQHFGALWYDTSGQAQIERDRLAAEPAKIRARIRARLERESKPANPQDRKRWTFKNGVYFKHGLCGHHYYPVWHNIMLTPANVYPPWLDARRFLSDLESLLPPRPAGHRFARIDTGGLYEPKNIQWQDPKSPLAPNKKPRARRCTASKVYLAMVGDRTRSGCWILALSPYQKYGRPRFSLRCACGKVFTARAEKVRAGDVRSCGCQGGSPGPRISNPQSRGHPQIISGNWPANDPRLLEPVTW
jgi:hypothetical protein